MNPETASAVTNPPPETPPSPVPAQKKPGLLRRWLGLWFDRDLDLEGRDTSDWNIYYYFYRQIAQHRAPIKLKHMKWLALLFQLYFFGILLLSIVRTLLVLSGKLGAPANDSEGNVFYSFLSMIGISANIYIMPLLLLAPVFMVCGAFKLQNKSRGLTSRAKEQPLLAHLVQYTSNKGLVTGALQSLFFTWGRLILLLLPAIAAATLMLAGFAAYVHSPRAISAAIGIPLCISLSVLTVSVFFVMQFFCYRLDTLMIIVGIGIQGVLLLLFNILRSGPFDVRLDYFWATVASTFVPSCLFACVYFPLAALDTSEYGLGKRISKRIRVLLYSTSAVFILLFLAGHNAAGYVTDENKKMVQSLFLFGMLGLFVSISSLLITSASITSPMAARQRRSHADEPFPRKLLDPASPVSLIPVFVLEVIAIFVVDNWNRELAEALSLREFDGASIAQIARIAWSAIHFSLLSTFIWQSRKPKRKDPWLSNVQFNLTCIVLVVFVPLFLLPFAEGNPAPIVHFASIGVFLLFIIWMKCKPASGDAVMSGVPAPEQNKEAS